MALRHESGRSNRIDASSPYISSINSTKLESENLNSSNKIKELEDGEEFIPVDKTDEAERKIYIGNLPFDTTLNQVKELLIEIGPIKSCSLISDRAGKSKGCALASFLNLKYAYNSSVCFQFCDEICVQLGSCFY